MSTTEYVSTVTAAEEIDLDARTIQRWCKMKKIPNAVKLGREWRIPKREWETFKARLMTRVA